jgi:general stress protein YciG
MTSKKGGKGFSEQPHHVAGAGKKGTGAIGGNLKKDPGRAVEAGHRSHEQRRGSGEES